MRVSNRQVVILQHRLLHYRLTLFEELRRTCADRGIELRLVHGQASERERLKKDTGILPWADQVRNQFLPIGGTDALWQPYPKELSNAALIVIMQESRILSNYAFLANRTRSTTKIAYWGHGKNFQSDAPAGLRERWKRLLLRRADWWFAYTAVTRDVLLANGYPVDRITVLNNAVDNQQLIHELASISEEELAIIRRGLDLRPNGKLGVFCGSLYPDKKLPFLLNAASRIHDMLPDFRLVIIGDGPSGPELRQLIAGKPWAHWVGVQKGRAKAAYFRAASVILNPGLVGLHILDAFCAGTPMVTTANARHSPEIAYLIDGVNGFVFEDDPDMFARATVALLQDETRHQASSKAAREAAEQYTLSQMVANFAGGIEQCLEADRSR